ncbi:MAG: lipase family protein [Cytophagales bacterium]|nr:MAG: lipase family protein [Cytophagales bacterium]TAF61555.1 MAG: lipase family protein [Cytophagales bacterium]
MQFNHYLTHVFSGFEQNAIQLSAKNAACLAICAELVYADWPLVEKVIQNIGFEYFKYTDLNGTQSFTVADNEKIIIAFRGTEISDFRDIATDVDRDLVLWDKPQYVPWGAHLWQPLGDVRTHEGFSSALNLIWTTLLSQIEECRMQAKGKERPIWLCGHSLGGALAHLAAAELWTLKVPLQGIYSFGQPRVGNTDFAAWFDRALPNKLFRFVNNNDVVPRVPYFSGYQHAGQMVYIDADGDFRNDRLSTMEMLWDRVRSSVGLDLGSDHKMANYIHLTAKLLGVNNLNLMKW